MNVIVDSSTELIAVYSLFAALEAGCTGAGRRDMLPYLGMALSEFNDGGQHVPAALHDAPFATFDQGLAELDAQISQAMERATTLPDALRFHHAREVLREGYLP